MAVSHQPITKLALLVDTREQKPLWTPEESSTYQISVMSRKLDHGDYSLEGLEHLITVERKRAAEIYTWVGSEREKTEAKLARMLQDGLGWIGLVVEGLEDKVLTQPEHSRVSPYVVRRSLAAFEIKYGIHIYYGVSRAAIKRWILDRFEFFLKHQQGGGYNQPT